LQRNDALQAGWQVQPALHRRALLRARGAAGHQQQQEEKRPRNSPA